MNTFESPETDPVGRTIAVPYELARDLHDEMASLPTPDAEMFSTTADDLRVQLAVFSQEDDVILPIEDGLDIYLYLQRHRHDKEREKILITERLEHALGSKIGELAIGA